MNGIMATILAVFQLGQLGDATRVEIAAKPTWKCDALRWVEAAQVTNGMFVGAAQAVCTFEASGGQGYSGLRGYLVEKTEKSKKVHQGPKNETYQKLESFFYDITHEMQFGDASVEVRADVHIASNLENKLVYDVFSTSIHATGQAQYLKKLDIQTRITSTQDKKVFGLVLLIRPNVKKPALIPSGMFRDELKKQIEKYAPDVERGVIEEIQPQI